MFDETKPRRNLAKVEAKTEQEARRLMKERFGDQVSIPTIRQTRPGIWRANWSLAYKKERRNRKISKDEQLIVA